MNRFSEETSLSERSPFQVPGSEEGQCLKALTRFVRPDERVERTFCPEQLSSLPDSRDCLRLSRGCFVTGSSSLSLLQQLDTEF